MVLIASMIDFQSWQRQPLTAAPSWAVKMCLLIITTTEYLYCGHSETHSIEKIDCNDSWCRHSKAHGTKEHWGLDCRCIEYLWRDHRYTPPVGGLCPHCILALENLKDVNTSTASQNEDASLIMQNPRQTSIPMVVPDHKEKRNTGTTSCSARNMRPCGKCQEERRKCTPVQDEPALCQLCKNSGMLECPPHQSRRAGARRGNSMASNGVIEYKFVNASSL
ncbi:uncharacterized protein FOMMEDRAFT_18368 [Fomitiporia mediterranea MF3/22]|uniref:uncharacterized protein n=1 Tax=Fomitiporia mediterranea (strain MF3/22) TaxID=694068 RepID=UPI00044076F4|nr:uncharacterized protein FOMMEDRAFT_18368 [Fomitiporia mediterranea MF3/22]EJD06207.1 hypothetical protein FOMMEDRAFT_18368 [Fomitiporia mediterranea MF3/22]